VVPAYDYIREHIEEQLRAFTTNEYLQEEDAKDKRTMLYTNTLNAQAKLLKYRKLLI
jgi:hypothetical protein